MRTKAGFTLIELLVVAVVIIIIVGMTVPNVVGFLAGRRMQSAEQTISSALTTARNLAIARRMIYSATVHNTPDFLINDEIMIRDRLGGYAGPKIELQDRIELAEATPGAEVQIFFRPDGSLGDPANPSLQRTDWPEIAFKEHNKQTVWRIQINPFTGLPRYVHGAE